jgi:hypothetical protein
MATIATPTDQLEPLRFFVGTWRCGGTMLASEHGPEHTFEATFEIEPILDGAWIAGRYREETSAQHPVALVGWEVWGYDAATESFVSRFFTNAGEAGTLTGSGWDNETWEWTGERLIGDTKIPFKAAFTRDGGDRFTLRPMLRPGDDLITVAELAFSRA